MRIVNAAGLTLKQAACLRFIARALEQSGGIGPTFKEIAVGVELISKSQVFRLVDALAERGYLQARPPQRARAIALTSAGHDWWQADRLEKQARGIVGDRTPPAPVCPACGSAWLHDRASKIFRPNCECEEETSRPAVAA